MSAKIYKFPTGEKESKSLPPYVAPASVGVWFVGVRQTLVANRENIFTQQPYFLVNIYNSVNDGEKVDFSIEVEGIKGLHAILNILVDAARQRNQDFLIADYSDGETGLSEEYRFFVDYD